MRVSYIKLFEASNMKKNQQDTIHYQKIATRVIQSLHRPEVSDTTRDTAATVTDSTS